MLHLRLLLVGLLVFFACGYETKKKELVIFHAGSFASPLRDLAKEFEKQYPHVKVKSESSGSRAACFKISHLKRKADVIVTADYKTIEDLLIPNYAHWYIKFVRNRMVLVFTEHSKYGNEINKDNWYNVLSRKEVNLGGSDPHLDPSGYYTLFVWQLADIYYKEKINDESIYTTLYEKSSGNLRPGGTELLPLLQNLSLDYIFYFLSVAKQHNLKYIILPPQIDLSDVQFDYYYAQAKITLPVKQRGDYSSIYGSSILYGVTIPSDAEEPDLAIQFVRFLLGQEGRRILKKNFQEVISSPLASDISKIPEGLRKMCAQ